MFALPVGVIASGLEDQVARRRDQKAQAETEEDGDEEEFVGDETTLRGRIYNFLVRHHTVQSRYFGTFVNALILGCAITFMFSSLKNVTGTWRIVISCFQFFSFLVFLVEYLLRMWSAGENPKHRGRGLLSYSIKFLHIIDALSIFPYWIGLVTLGPDVGVGYTLFLLLKIFRVGDSNKSFLTFGKVLKGHYGVLIVTGFSAVLLWIFFASILYFTERDNPDEDMRTYYNTIPNAMW